jgi:hypothetical protein
MKRTFFIVLRYGISRLECNTVVSHRPPPPAQGVSGYSVTSPSSALGFS